MRKIELERRQSSSGSQGRARRVRRSERSRIPGTGPVWPPRTSFARAKLWIGSERSITKTALRVESNHSIHGRGDPRVVIASHDPRRIGTKSRQVRHSATTNERTNERRLRRYRLVTPAGSWLHPPARRPSRNGSEPGVRAQTERDHVRRNVVLSLRLVGPRRSPVARKPAAHVSSSSAALEILHAGRRSGSSRARWKDARTRGGTG